MEPTYIVIRAGDGVTLERMGESALLKRLNEGYWGRGAYASKTWTVEMIAKSGNRVDLEEHEGLFIVRGDFVEPKPKQTVTEWTIE